MRVRDGRGCWGRLLAVLSVAALYWSVAAAGVAAGSESRSFEPDYAMSKQYVAVTTYKILRDYAPDTIQHCQSDVKQELNRFDDLDSAGVFTRGAINCLHKLGYLQGLPGGTPSDFGEWNYWEQDNRSVEGYTLFADETDWGDQASIGVRCSTISDHDEDLIWFWLTGIGLSFDHFEEVEVEYHLEGGQVIKERWGGGAYDDASYSWVEPVDQDSFARQLRSAGTGNLRVSITDSDDTHAVSALFEIDGVLSVLDTLTCWSKTFDPDYKMSKQYVAVTTYKILRDHAPDTIQHCKSDVKQELNRFDDLDSAGAFTRGAINCLHKLGYLQGLPGGTPSDFGEWNYWEQDNLSVEGYTLITDETDWGNQAIIGVRCSVGDHELDLIAVGFLGIGLSFDDSEQVGVFEAEGAQVTYGQVEVEYLLEGGQVIKERWDAQTVIPDDAASSPSSNLRPVDQDSFARQLRSAGTGNLRVSIADSDDAHAVSALFEIDGVLSVLDTLTCW